ncbi:hypothetical protein DRO64_04790 [Candidatus Bathyarchaeota archaeon]|nr:MAG: hypothetical protein DRO64_04790 [Candidatus Bathyarchaeota archaeon]
MTLTLEVYDSETSTWIDKTNSCASLRRQIRSNGLEELDGELVKDVVSVGQEIRLKEDGQIVFEGIVYEVDRRHRGRDVERCGFKAYDYLIKYDRHVVYRAYPTGTKAGDIIKDLASLEDGVDVSNVDDGDSLLSPWSIENEKALDVMKSVARGTNYWLRMKPGLKLYFKPKQVGTSKATIDSSIVLDAEYSEDRWKLKNRVIYVGKDGEILADVSEGAGDLPVVIHDPFLTDPNEAQRRANIRLALNKEYGRSLRITIHRRDFKDLGIDLGDTCTINLSSVGVSGVDMVLLGIEYDPRDLRYRLEFGGRKELLEDWLDERIGGDVAARFGQKVDVPEYISTITYELEAVQRIQGESRYVKYWNKPPLTLYNAQNIQLNDDGHATLISGATSGSFEAQVTPPSDVMFIGFMNVEWSLDKGDGDVIIKILRGDDSIVKQISGSDIDEGEYWFDRLPRKEGEWFEGAASKWGKSNGDVSDVTLGILHPQNLKLTPDTLGSDMEAWYPSSKDARWDLSWAKFMRLYLYGDHPEAKDFSIKIRLHTDADNYYEGTINVKHGTWKKYEVLISSLSQVGSPNLSNINWISILTPYELLIDGDYIFLPLTRELVRVKFELSRPSADADSPKIRWVKIGWREGT